MVTLSLKPWAMIRIRSSALQEESFCNSSAAGLEHYPVHRDVPDPFADLDSFYII